MFDKIKETADAFKGKTMSNQNDVVTTEEDIRHYLREKERIIRSNIQDEFTGVILRFLKHKTLSSSKEFTGDDMIQFAYKIFKHFNPNGLLGEDWMNKQLEQFRQQKGSGK